jgi:hypothetical protein
MKIRENVKIGGRNYHVKILDEVSESDPTADGLCVIHKQEIRLKKDMDPESDYCKNMFLHEILHGLFEMVGLDDEEDVIVRLSNGLYQLITDNPELFSN